MLCEAGNLQISVEVPAPASHLDQIHPPKEAATVESKRSFGEISQAIGTPLTKTSEPKAPFRCHDAATPLGDVETRHPPRTMPNSISRDQVTGTGR